VLTLREIAQETWGILAPRACPGCQRPGSLLCARCASAFSGGYLVPELALRRELLGVDVVACASYTPIVRKALTAFKDGGLYRLAPFLAPPMASLLSRLIEVGQDQLLLVPVPSSLQGWLRRGYEPTWILAKEIQRLLPSTYAFRGIRRGNLAASGPAHFGLSRAARLSRSAGYVGSARMAGHPVILVDDVITTGATLERASRAVREAGGTVVAAIACAATTPGRPGGGDL
jgi:predicted amidophosphoribosyltransferase